MNLKLSNSRPKWAKERHRKANHAPLTSRINRIFDLEKLELAYGPGCLAYGATGVELTIDHVIPKSHGGPKTIDNMQPLCFKCNLKKGARKIDFRPKDWKKRLGATI